MLITLLIILFVIIEAILLVLILVFAYFTFRKKLDNKFMKFMGTTPINFFKNKV